MDRITLQTVADFTAHLTLNRLVLQIFVALPPMLLELIHRGNNDSLAERAEVI